MGGRGVRMTYHGAKGNGAGGVVVDGDEVDEERHAAHEARHEECAEHHLLDPHLASHARVDASTEIAVHRGSCSVNKDGRAQQRTTPSGKPFS